MKFLVAVLALFHLLANVGFVNSVKTVKIKTIKQKLDHFDEKNDKTWDMRYMVTDKYFKDGGPMFIYVGNENEILPGYAAYGMMGDLAHDHNGIVFHNEHRFYGKSKITSDFSNENLRYLNTKQALADLAHFIRHMRKTDPRLAKSKVIIVGCSYAGNLVVWFNRLYKDLVDGTWALSGPIFAKSDFKEYYEIIGRAIKELGSQQCYDRIKNGITELEKMFDGDRADEAKKALNLCDIFDYNKKLDLWTVFREIASLFANIVVFPKEAKDDVASRCKWLMKQKDDVTAIGAYYQEKYKGKCADRNYYSDNYHYNRTDNDKRAWLYQMCNEFGYFQTSASDKQPFGTKHSVNGDLQLCADAFGAKFTKDYINAAIANTNKEFGGKTPKVKNVYMTHCSLDPWSALAPGASDDVSVVPKCSHCSHIYSIDKDDSPEMRASKERVFALVRKWLS